MVHVCDASIETHQATPESDVVQRIRACVMVSESTRDAISAVLPANPALDDAAQAAARALVDAWPE